MPNQTKISLAHHRSHRRLVAEEEEPEGLAVNDLRTRQEEKRVLVEGDRIGSRTVLILCHHPPLSRL